MIAAVILGAGLSRRLGRPKQLLRLGGKTIIEHVTENVLQTEVCEVIVVVGAYCQEVEQVLNLYPVKCIYNSRFKDGIGTSVAAGAKVVAPHVKGIMFVVGDQPLLSPEYMNQMLKFFLEKKPLILKPEKGMPAIFAEELRQELMALTGDIGGRQLIKKYREKVITFSAIPENQSLDIDTQEDYQRVLEMWMFNGR
ncbi:MAG: nucleotidyltransferase family protein [Syntrophaceticus sp.]|nr:nucleotidyltransferase family protein [Syntrophaceticus sp.]MDD3315311.1 nucleotidyltransferase family protein [Syntrophaceticus sp.]MDD4783757.1 nucleotidyltransferase family protein [Syntrophaceticus sp.]